MTSVTKVDLRYPNDQLIKGYNRIKTDDPKKNKSLGEYLFLGALFCVPTIFLLSILLLLHFM
jgi:hypothetical protein